MLSLTSTLKKGMPYTLTFDGRAVFNFAGVSSIKEDLAARLGDLGMGEVTDVSRALFSNYYAVTIIPAETMPLSDMVAAFVWVWPLVGFPDASFLSAEGGMESSQPGGMAELLPSVGKAVGETVSDTIGATLRPLVPYLVIGAAIVVVVVFWPRIVAGRA